jgi:hypothetical protein
MPDDDQTNGNGLDSSHESAASPNTQVIPRPPDTNSAPAVPVTRTISRRRRLLIRGLHLLMLTIAVWLLSAYVILPTVWRHYEHQPGLENAPKTSYTPQAIPGDPLNIGLIGEEDVLIKAMITSGWDPADPITLLTSYRIASSVLRSRPYPAAPVSSLYLFGRKQDLAFEKSVGNSARRRHHVRFWKTTEFGRGNVPLWLGAVTFDRSVGLSHRTGQITHHIAPDIDAERHGLVVDLSKAGWLTQIFEVTGVGATLLGRNGGGDRYFTDGELAIGVLASAAAPKKSPDQFADPVVIQVKEQLWSAIRPLLQSLPGQ